MERLTNHSSNYCIMSNCDKFINGHKKCFGNYCLEYNSYTKLGQYENTGLTPDELTQLKTENEKLKAHIEEINSYIEMSKDKSIYKKCADLCIRNAQLKSQLAEAMLLI